MLNTINRPVLFEGVTKKKSCKMAKSWKICKFIRINSAMFGRPASMPGRQAHYTFLHWKIKSLPSEDCGLFTSVRVTCVFYMRCRFTSCFQADYFLIRNKIHYPLGPGSACQGKYWNGWGYLVRYCHVEHRNYPGKCWSQRICVPANLAGEYWKIKSMACFCFCIQCCGSAGCRRNIASFYRTSANPWIAANAMSYSSVSVMANTPLLRWKYCKQFANCSKCVNYANIFKNRVIWKKDSTINFIAQ